jgi:hypothetical protein
MRIWCTLLSPVACRVLPYFSTLSHKQRDFRERVIEHVDKPWIMWEPNCSMRIYRLTDRHDETDSRFSQKIALRTTGIKANQVGPIRIKEDRLATHILLRFSEHISCVSEHNEVSHAFFLDDGWVVSKMCITGIISNVFCMEAGLSAQCVYTLNWLHIEQCQSLWPRGLRCGSVAARLLGLLVRIPAGLWRFVSCDCCVLSNRGSCVGPITRPKKSYPVGWDWVSS